MLPPDVALVQLINRTAMAYQSAPPAYITYDERTHVSATGMGRSQDINRFVAVRQADDFAVMRDLPEGRERIGQAFPIIPYFDPFAGFSYSWFANLRRIDITLQRQEPHLWPMPQTDPSVDVTMPYISFWLPSYQADSTSEGVHFRVEPTPQLQSGQLYPYDITVDAKTGLPAHIELRFLNDPTRIVLDYQTIGGHWVLTHAIYSAPQRVGPLNFTVVSDTVYENIAFPLTPPDPRLAGTPSPGT